MTWMKTEGGNMTTIRELRNLSTEEPSPAMFTVPAHYSVIEREAKPGSGPALEAVLPKRRAPGPK